MRGTGNIAGLFLVWWLCAEVPARAEPALTPRIRLVLDAELSAATGLYEALLAQVADLEVKVISEARTSELPGALFEFARSHRTPEDRGVVWVTRAGADVLVWVASGTAEKSLLRAVPRADPTSSSTQETVAVIVRSSMEGLLAQASIDFVPPVSSLAAGPRAPGLPNGPALYQPELSIAYAGASLSREVSWQHGARVAVGFYNLFAPGPYTQLAVSFVRDQRVSEQGVRLLISRTPFEAVFGTRIPFGTFAIAPELSLGLELSSRTAQSGSEDIKPRAGRRRFSAFVGAQAFLLSALGGPRARSFLLIGGGVEAVLNNVDYRVEVLGSSEPGSMTSILVSPRTFRPVAKLGLRVLL